MREKIKGECIKKTEVRDQKVRITWRRIGKVNIDVRDEEKPREEKIVAFASAERENKGSAKLFSDSAVINYRTHVLKEFCTAATSL